MRTCRVLLQIHFGVIKYSNVLNTTAAADRSSQQQQTSWTCRQHVQDTSTHLHQRLQLFELHVAQLEVVLYFNSQCRPCMYKISGLAAVLHGSQIPLCEAALPQAVTDEVARCTPSHFNANGKLVATHYVNAEMDLEEALTLRQTASLCAIHCTAGPFNSRKQATCRSAWYIGMICSA